MTTARVYRENDTKMDGHMSDNTNVDNENTSANQSGSEIRREE